MERLVNLKKLHLEANHIFKISGLDSLSNLEELELSGNEISKIEGLNNLRNLKELLLNKNKIKKIEGLEKLIHLEHLDLSDNQGTTIDLRAFSSPDLIRSKASLICSRGNLFVTSSLTFIFPVLAISMILG